jgi:hypothetical protein
MKKFTIYKDNQIIARHEGLEEEVKNICEFKEWLYLEGWPTDTQYISNDQIVDFPDKPSEIHTWNWGTLSWAKNLELAEQNIRRQRQELLESTDWTQLPDVPNATRVKYQAYRQALRDITAQESFPETVTFPEITE